MGVALSLVLTRWQITYWLLYGQGLSWAARETVFGSWGRNGPRHRGNGSVCLRRGNFDRLM
jgi:hypothetical protein